MYDYGTVWNSYITWITATISNEEMIVDDAVPMRYVEKHDGISYGGWQIAVEDAIHMARGTGRTHYVLPVRFGHSGRGGGVSHLVSGGIRVGVTADNKRVRVPTSQSERGKCDRPDARWSGSRHDRRDRHRRSDVALGEEMRMPPAERLQFLDHLTEGPTIGERLGISEGNVTMQAPEKIDRRKRHSDDPTIAITVNIPVTLKQQLDDVIIERGTGTRSGLITMAVSEWLTKLEQNGG